MIHISLRSAIAPLVAAIVSMSPVAAQQYPAEPGDGVADMAGIIPAAAADTLRTILAELRTAAGVEVRVLTVKNVARYGTGDATPEAFATGVYNDWNLGYGQAQDGVLVMVSVDDRFARIELGDNVPADKDARMQAIMDEQMVPRFREGDYGAGVMEGVRAIAGSFRESGGYGTAPQPVGGFSDSQPAAGGDEVMAGVVGLLILVAGGAGLSSYRRYRKRSCKSCGLQMQRLDESADDVYLDSGRRLEEVLGSVDYDVWHCAGCGNHQVLSYGSMLSGRQACPSCSYRTVEVHKSVLEHPTYTSQGREQINKDCRHCGWSDTDIVYLPRLQRSTSSSSRSFSSGSGSRSSGGGWSGGGGSSGGGGGGGSSGGSSSGRGASGRW